MQYHLFKSYVDQKDWANAVTEGLVMCSKYPLTEYAKDIQFQVGEYYYRLGQTEKAIAHYQTIVDKNLPNTEPAAIGDYKKGEIYERLKNYKQARIEYDKVKTKHPLVTNWFILSRYSDAMTYYDEAMDSRGKKDTVKNKLAVEKLTGFAKTYPSDKRTPRAYMTLANIERESGNSENALLAYNKVISFNANGMTNVAAGFLEKELDAHKQLVTEARLAKASLLKNMSANSGEILKEYQSVLSVDPLNEDALIGKGICLIQAGNKDEAVAVLTKVIESGKENKQMARELINSIKGGQ